MFLFENHNFAFLHINKTGGTSTTVFLKEAFDESPKIIGLGWNYGAEEPKIHEPLSYKIERFTSLGIDFRGIKFLTTIRNPYERWVSLYTASQRNVIERVKKVIYERAYLATQWPFDRWFEEYVRGPARNDHEHRSLSQYIFVQGEYVSNLYVPNNLHIIKLEDLKEKLPEFIRYELGIETDLIVPEKNVTNYLREKESIMDYYPDHLRKLVYQEEKYIIDKYYPEFKYEG